MGIIGTIIMAILLCIVLAETVILCIFLVKKSQTQRRTAQKKIPADWDRIMQETTLERRKGKK